MFRTTFLRLSLALAMATVGVADLIADIVVLADGTTKTVYNIEVASKYLYYTQTPDDENIERIPLDKVFAYKIGDGQLVALNGAQAPVAAEQAAAPQADTPVGEVAPVPSADNSRLIGLYNSHAPLEYKGKKPQPDKYTGYFISLWGMEETSVLSDSVLEIGFEHVYLEGDKDRSIVGERLKVTNKTSTPVYIDLANSFRLMNNGYSEPFFTNSVYNEGASSTAGGSLNLGAVTNALGVGGAVGALANGINVGKADTRSAGISKAEQQYLVVPPRSSVTMPGRKVSNGKTILECYEPIYFSQKKIGEAYEKYYLKDGWVPELTLVEDMKAQKVADDQAASRESLEIRRWMQTDYTPETTPKKLGWVVTYSTQPDFSRYTSLPVHMFMRGAFGLNVNSNSYYIYYNAKTYDPSPNHEYMITGKGRVGKE